MSSGDTLEWGRGRKSSTATTIPRHRRGRIILAFVSSVLEIHVKGHTRARARTRTHIGGALKMSARATGCERPSKAQRLRRARE